MINVVNTSINSIYIEQTEMYLHSKYNVAVGPLTNSLYNSFLIRASSQTISHDQGHHTSSNATYLSYTVQYHGENICDKLNLPNITACHNFRPVSS